MEHAQHAQGGGWAHGGVSPRGHGGLRAGDRAPRAHVLHRGRRAGQDSRKHVSQREHRTRQRDGDRVRQARGRCVGGDRGRGDEALRLHEVHAWPGRRGALYTARSALSRVEDADPQLSHAIHRAGGRDQRGDARILGGARGRRYAQRPRDRSAAEASAVKIAVVGTGYVGLVAGACLAETGNDVACADVDAAKIESLRQNRLPIHEPGLEPLVVRNQRDGRLEFTTDVGAAVERSDVIFIAVGTPPGEDGSADLQHVLEVARTIGRHMDRPKLVVTKSTVPVGTAERVRGEIAKHTSTAFHICANPEFLKEGAAVEDFMKPDRVIVGVDSAEAADVMSQLYAPFVRTGNPIIFMDLPSAEMTKYAANAMLATRISFMNQIALLCDAVGADVTLVRKGIGTDRRIGPAFLFPGPGYGGSCFPKDVKALIRTGEDR